MQAHAEDQFRVAQVFIIGNTETPAYLIRILLPFREGETVSGADLRLAQSRLRQVGLWAMPRVTVLDSPDRREWKDVLVQIEERPWNWLLSAGYEIALYWLTGELSRLNHVGLQVRNRVVEWLRKP